MLSRRNLAKRIAFLVGGICWFLFAAAFGFFLWQYVTEGAGFHLFRLAISGWSILIGLVHVIGLLLAAALCFAIGAVLCARGLARAPKDPSPSRSGYAAENHDSA